MRRVITPRLDALRDRVERWRRDRGEKRSRIPEELWSGAVDLARAEGVYVTAKALRFDYYNLKARVDHAEPQQRTDAAPEGPRFIEIEPVQLGCGGKTVLELVGPRGARMRIDVTGATTVDIVGLAQAFWRHDA